MTEARFNTLYLSLTDLLYRIAAFILEDEAEAEDAVQQTFLKLWEKRGGLDHIANHKSFAIKVLKNVCMDRMRKASHLSLSEKIPDVEATFSLDANLHEKQKLSAIQTAIGSLPEGQRKVLILRCIEGLSYEEISKKTGMSHLTLRVLLSRARTTLRKIYEDN